MERLPIQGYYEDKFAVCYGCGMLNKDGLQLKTFLSNNETISRHKPKENKTAINDYLNEMNNHKNFKVWEAYVQENNIDTKGSIGNNYIPEK